MSTKKGKRGQAKNFQPKTKKGTGKKIPCPCCPPVKKNAKKLAGGIDNKKKGAKILTC